MSQQSTFTLSRRQGARHLTLLLFLAVSIAQSLFYCSIASATPVLDCESTVLRQVPKGDAVRNAGSLWNSPLVDSTNKFVTIKDKRNRDVDIEFAGSMHVSSNGNWIMLCYSDLVSPAFMSEYLKEKVSNAVIIERKPRMNESGAVDGERIVVRFSIPTNPDKPGPGDPHEIVTTVIRTDDTNYSEISCKSPDDLFAFEKEVDEVRKNTARQAPKHSH
jgi:hypothetical protein